MANIKQRYIKPGRDFNYSEGVKVKATEAVYQDQVVYVDGSSGPFLTVSIADANAAGEFNGRLMVAKHDIPANSYGIVLPWKLVTDFDTSASGAVGDPVYISATTGTSRASNLTFTAPTGSNQIIVGRVTVDHATTGAMMLWPGAPELHATGGYASAGAGTGVARETITFPCLFPGTGGATINFTAMPVPIILVDAYMIAGNNSQPEMTVLEAGNLAITCAAPAAATGAVGRATVIAHGNCDIAAGGTLRLTKTNGHAEDIAIITAIYA
jgi:hypothetical protein